MIKCKNCGTLLPDDANFCDNCGSPVVKEPPRVEYTPDPSRYGKRNSRITTGVTIAFVLFLLAVGTILITSISTMRQASDYTDPFEGLQQITAEEYSSIEHGMTYDEIAERFGASDYGFDEGSYRWPGEYYDELYSYCEFTFNAENKLVGKSEYNLLEGDKVIADMDRSAAVITPETADEIRKGMTLAEVEELFGGSGTLHNSSSDDSGKITRVYCWSISEDADDPDFEEDKADWYYDNYILVEFNERDTVAYWDIW